MRRQRPSGRQRRCGAPRLQRIHAAARGLEHNRASRGRGVMKRVLSVFVASLAIIALPAITFAGQASGAAAKPAPQTKPETKPAPPKTLTAAGTVEKVAPDSLTVKGKTESLTFTIDKETSVTAKGATHKTLELKAEGKGTKLTD